ncbi:hypothetical protein OR1_01376 [Geobacter sp. OR-1]|uniref:hypothetical protein n=1 Tax=Geobacter sp. OR-1 TaxID=1266765 RepID=UPI00054451BC|nr:hypothetical protein [Geobacter sp. OR-1]GAM09102.1 hypothetical protein OR1_01376 [Geobacter sp. OR-1]
MTVKRLRTIFIPLLLILVISGIRIANFWDISDIHNAQTLHIDQADPFAGDLDNTKKKQLVLPVLAFFTSVLSLLKPASYILTPVFIFLITPLAFIALALPSRASPA